MALKLVHPHLGDPQSVAPHVGRQVLGVGLMGALDMSDAGAGKDLHAAPTLPHLGLHISVTTTTQQWNICVCVMPDQKGSNTYLYSRSIHNFE